MDFSFEIIIFVANSESYIQVAIVTGILCLLALAHHGSISNGASFLYLNSKGTMKVFIIVEDCGNDETRNVACLATEAEAESFCNKRNTSRPYRFNYEEWEVGEVLNELKEL